MRKCPSSSFLMFSGTAQKTWKNMEKLAFSRPLGGSLVRNAQPLRNLLHGRARNLLAQRSRNAIEQLARWLTLSLPLHQPRPPLRGTRIARLAALPGLHKLRLGLQRMLVHSRVCFLYGVPYTSPRAGQHLPAAQDAHHGGAQQHVRVAVHRAGDAMALLRLYSLPFSRSRTATVRP